MLSVDVDEKMVKTLDDFDVFLKVDEESRLIIGVN